MTRRDLSIAEEHLDSFTSTKMASNYTADETEFNSPFAFAVVRLRFRLLYLRLTRGRTRFLRRSAPWSRNRHCVSI